MRSSHASELRVPLKELVHKILNRIAEDIEQKRQVNLQSADMKQPLTITLANLEIRTCLVVIVDKSEGPYQHKNSAKRTEINDIADVSSSAEWLRDLARKVLEPNFWKRIVF